MSNEQMRSRPTAVGIAPWLSVANAAQAIVYYKRAFGVVAIECLEEEPGRVVVAHLSLAGASFWVQQDPDTCPSALEGRSSVRMILTVDDPDTVFKQAIAAGATEVFAISEDHGWRIGRIADPFGHHWEIGKPLR